MTEKIDRHCIMCAYWQYNERIEQKHGMGSGICERDNEIKGCDRKICLLYEERKKHDKTGS